MASYGTFFFMAQYENNLIFIKEVVSIHQQNYFVLDRSILILCMSAHLVKAAGNEGYDDE